MVKFPFTSPVSTRLLKSTLKHKRIEFITDGKKAVEDAQVLFVAVGTPEGEDGSAD